MYLNQQKIGLKGKGLMWLYQIIILTIEILLVICLVECMKTTKMSFDTLIGSHHYGEMEQYFKIYPEKFNSMPDKKNGGAISC